jgi:peroxiredoxin
MDDIFKQIHLNLEGNDNILVIDSLVNLSVYTNIDISTICTKMNKIYLDFILSHNNYRIVPDLLYLLTKSEQIPIDTIKYIYANLPEHSKTGLMGKLALMQIENFERDKYLTEDEDKDDLTGNFTPDFTRKDASGKTIRLSEYQNKNYVLLNFWASWCGPCIREIPKMKNLYEKCSQTELQIIGISLDTDSNKWLNAINKYKLDQWPQILSIQNENNSTFNINEEALDFMYNVNAIPHFILIDKQGKIIARWGYIGKEQLIEIDRILK